MRILPKEPGRRKAERNDSESEAYYMADQWELMRRKFQKHKAAKFSLVLLIFIYTCAAFAEFLAPHTKTERFEYVYCPPRRIRFFDEEGFHGPFVYAMTKELNKDTFLMEYTNDASRRSPVKLFVRGGSYRFWGLFRTDIHLFGTGSTEAPVLLFGTDKLGRDIFSRNLYAARISLSIGLIGVALTFVLGVFFGGIAGYYGGRPDMFISRLIEFLKAIPSIPLWMALAAAMPPGWSPLMVYAGMTVILSIKSWTSLARVVRGKFLELREEDFVLAAKVLGAKDSQVILKHLVPSFMSYLIVVLTLAIPGMILSETSLSFLGLGLRAPVVSWGTLLNAAQSFSVVKLYPWLIIPGLFVVVTVLAFNFLGDGLRDAADPYKP